MPLPPINFLSKILNHNYCTIHMLLKKLYWYYVWFEDFSNLMFASNSPCLCSRKLNKRFQFLTPYTRRETKCAQRTVTTQQKIRDVYMKSTRTSVFTNLYFILLKCTIQAFIIEWKIFFLCLLKLSVCTSLCLIFFTRYRHHRKCEYWKKNHTKSVMSEL